MKLVDWLSPFLFIQYVKIFGKKNLIVTFSALYFMLCK